MRWLATAALLTAWPALAGAQNPRFEAGGQVLGLLADRDYVGAGPWLGWRVAPSFRLGLLATVGTQASQTAGRLELAGHFLVDPGRKRGAGIYLAAGVACNVADDSRAFLMAGIGVEGSPGGRGGWVLELGAGGGWRATAGYRWRWGGRRPGR